ncbi:MAG: hypothetical protein ACOYD0_01230 [Candidatus Nanopelagicales bacterium]
MLASDQTDQVWTRIFSVLGTNPFTLAQAQTVGVTRAQLRTAERRGLVTRVQRDSYLLPEFSGTKTATRDHHLQQCRVVALAAPGSVISHHSAALLHDLSSGRPSLDPGNDRVHVTIHKTHRSGAPLYDVSSSRLPPDHIVSVDGLLVTSVARTALDLARINRLPLGQAPVDAAARMIISGNVDASEVPLSLRESVQASAQRTRAIQELWTAADHMRGFAGIAYARDAIDLCEPASESALESVSRWQMCHAGVPLPNIGTLVRGASGSTYYADFLWQEFKIIGEADGESKYTDRRVLVAEKHREDDLRAAGWNFVRWNWHEAFQEPHLMLDKLAMAFRNAA